MGILSHKFIKSSPLFLLGTGRSGTTLLQRILNSHEDICLWGEHGGFLSHIAQAYMSSYEKINVEFLFGRNINEQPVKLAVKKLRDQEYWSAWHNWFGRKSIINNSKIFVESFFNPPELKVKYWGFKEIRYGIGDNFLPFAKEVFPDAKFIFVVRKPLDVITSQIISFRNGNKEDFIKIANNWVIQNRNFLNFKEKNPKRVFVIRYEDVIKNPEKFLSDLFNFLGLKMSEKQLGVILSEKGRGESRINKMKDSIFSEQENIIISKITSNVASDLGYE